MTTSIDALIDELVKLGYIEGRDLNHPMLIETIKQAKEKHRAEIIDAWNSAGGGDAHTIGEQYYYSTFIP